MKSRDEIVIIMLQWLRVYTLGSRGSRELMTFLEIHLISSRIDQKLKNKGRITSVLKVKISPKSWAIVAVVGAILRGRGSDSLARRRGSRISGEFFLKLASKEATIAPRSGHDRGSIVISILQ